MPCLPGFFPVMKLLHAGKVQGGRVERNRPCVPSSSNCAIAGSLPCATQGRIKSKVAPSQPIMNTDDIFCSPFAPPWMTGWDGAFGYSLVQQKVPEKSSFSKHCYVRVETWRGRPGATARLRDVA